MVGAMETRGAGTTIRIVGIAPLCSSIAAVMTMKARRFGIANIGWACGRGVVHYVSGLHHAASACARGLGLSGVRAVFRKDIAGH
jgi:hypothetical protein